MTIENSGRATVNWPTNTAIPPQGWDRLTDTDGTLPPMWFAKTDGDGSREVVRGLPGRGKRRDFDEADRHLRAHFTAVQRSYTFPDTGGAADVATHSFTNLDFCGGWQPAITQLHSIDENEAFLDRTVTGAKPASGLLVKDADVTAYRQRAEEAGLSAVVYDHWLDGTTHMWVAPVRLGDRVDLNALRHCWHALAAADTDRPRANRIMKQATEGLRGAFAADLTAPPVTRQSARTGESHLTLPWWDEHSAAGLVMLGALLGYPPASTYAILCE